MEAKKPVTALRAAILAAREFKQLLDIQAPNTLFFPRHKGDARTTATYGHASRLLDQCTAQDLEGTKGAGMERRLVLPIVDVIAHQGAGVPPNQLQLFAGIIASIAQLVIQVLEENDGRGEHRGLLEVVVRFGGEADLPLEQIESERDAIHEAAPGKVDEQPLCHGGITAQGAR